MTSKKFLQSTCAYTPGLKIKRATKVRKVRRLSIPGEVLVKKGDVTSFDTVVARASLPGHPYVLRATTELRIESRDLPKYMVKNVGDPVKKGEPFAQFIGFFGLLKKFCRSPVDGFIESVSEVTGQVVVREAPIPLDLLAYISGNVVEVLPKEGVCIEANSAIVQGIFGVGGETNGVISVFSNSPKDTLNVETITKDYKGKIIVMNSRVTNDALIKAAEMGVKGIVTGSIDGSDLKDFLGYEIGVAITGQEKKGLTLVVTEGFGEIEMSKIAFNLFKKFDGFPAAICGATQIRAGVLRPEVIIPHDEEAPQNRDKNTQLQDIRIGSKVRVIKEPYFGEIAEILDLPFKLETIDTGSKVRVAYVKLESGLDVQMPRANLEIIEE